MKQLNDFPKIHCPFVRVEYPINNDDYNKHKKRLKLRSAKVYIVEDEINEGYDWVFNDPDTFAVEKLDGTNVRLETTNGELTCVMNRKNIINPLLVSKRNGVYITQSILKAIERGYIKSEGQQDGECIGPKFQGNLYKLVEHEWYPFSKAITQLKYNSFNQYERNYKNLSSWFENFLFSRYFQRITNPNIDPIFAEGVVFYNLKRKSEGKIWRAKLRRDMFFWYYDNVRILK